MRIRYIIFSILILFCLNIYLINAEQIKVNIYPEKEKIYLGERVKFFIKIKADKNVLNIKDNIKLKLKNLKDIYFSNLKKESKTNSIVYTFYLQFFKTGPIKLPAFDFIVNLDGEKLKIFSDELKINILSNLKKDTKFQPIKPPIKVGFYLTKKELYLLLLIILICLISIFFIYKFLKRKKVKSRVEIHVNPYDEFKKNVLRCEELIKKGMKREFYFLISETIRRYIDRKFGTTTLEATINEIKEIFHNLTVIENDLKEEILKLFDKWELFKFTGVFLDNSDAERDLEKTVKLVEKMEKKEENVQIS